MSKLGSIDIDAFKEYINEKVMVAHNELDREMLTNSIDVEKIMILAIRRRELKSIEGIIDNIVSERKKQINNT